MVDAGADRPGLCGSSDNPGRNTDPSYHGQGDGPQSGNDFAVPVHMGEVAWNVRAAYCPAHDLPACGILSALFDPGRSTGRLPISAELFLPMGDWEKMNIEHRTSNIEH